jgi:hypothetical protein
MRRPGHRSRSRARSGVCPWQKGSAIASLGPAVAVAHESWNDETAGLLSQVVDIVEPVTGTVRQKRRVADADEMALDTRSSKTVRVKK